MENFYELDCEPCFNIFDFGWLLLEKCVCFWLPSVNDFLASYSNCLVIFTEVDVHICMLRVQCLGIQTKITKDNKKKETT